MVRGKYEEGLRKQLLEYLQQRVLAGPTGSRFLELLFLSSFKLINTNTRDQAPFLRHLHDLFAEVFRLYERILSRSRAEQLHYILPTFLLVVQLYHGSLVPLSPSLDIINSLLKVIESIQKP